LTDELTLKVNGRKLTGWSSISVTRGIEMMPSTFIIEATEASPLYNDALMVQEGQACTVSLGSDLAITGYVDTVVARFGAGAHAVTIQGRGKCQDLVDCSAEWKGCQISGANPLEIAQKLAAPYGISVKALVDTGGAVPQFNINVGETPADILELITRHAALLYYEGTDGNLILAQVGTEKVGSGLVEGQNVQSASVIRSQAARYSEYKCSLLSLDTSSLFQDGDGLFFFKTTDPNVKRNRKLFTVAEGVMGGNELAERRAIWDAARRAGRGKQVTVTVDSWRDGKGKLWTPNTLAPVTLPSLKLKEAGLCIAQVTYCLALGSGRTAELLLMPKEAFMPQPVQIQPLVGGLPPAPVSAAGH
jgi:prophage tail gpP-like protein